ncbi:MarR family transcriptional regulator [Candidatus Sumerlaeota bacterium]|nr:MarR family transcriptional regulator [Candidatus Sumerlaeota bacterium]
MGTKWGINRTVAQIHALLYLAPEPLTADEIMETLSIARSNVSTSLKELQNWGLVKTVHILGDRRERFETMGDVWEMFRIVLEERKRREIDPTLELLRECVADLEKPAAADEPTKAKIGAMRDFFETMGNLYDQLKPMPTGAVVKLARMGSKLSKMIGLAGN